MQIKWLARPSQNNNSNNNKSCNDFSFYVGCPSRGSRDSASPLFSDLQHLRTPPPFLFKLALLLSLSPSLSLSLPMIQKRRRVGPDENRFDSLPDALLLLIFSKVADLNTLVFCSSVCKRFRLLVPQIDTVSLPLDYFDRGGSASGGSVRALRRIFKSFGFKLIGPRSSASVCCSSSRVAPYDQLSRLKHRFRELGALRVELRNSTRSRGDDAVRNSLTWWKAVFGSRLETCVVLSAASICRASAGTSGGVGSVRETMSESDMKSILETTKCSLVNASFRLVYFVPRDHGRLRSVVVSDDAERGKLCMGEEELASFNGSSSAKRNSAEKLRSQRLRSLRGPLRVNVWYVPVLDLPASGRCMKRVKIAVARREDDRQMAMERDAELLVGAFGEGGERGKACDEAVVEMMRSSRKKRYELKIPHCLE